tara:strand:- start:228 stop:482 length:255 start_codon:yes stop_codon:yes gene_type:complete
VLVVHDGESMGQEIEIRMTEGEAWVLFDFVQRFSDTDKLEIIDQAEERALWNLCCIFEKTLELRTGAEYQDVIAISRDKLREEV